MAGEKVPVHTAMGKMSVMPGWRENSQENEKRVAGRSREEMCR